MLLAVWALTGCGRQAAAAARTPSTPLSRVLTSALDAGTADAAPRAAAPAKEPKLALDVSPLPVAAPNPMPSVEIRRPRADERLALEHAARFPIELRVEHWPAQGVELVLDDFRARLLSTFGAPVRLGALVPADQRLAPGEHRLVAIAVRPDGTTVKPADAGLLQPYAAVRFSVGAPEVHAVSTAPRLIYSEPRGTYNGARAADGAFIDYYLLNAPGNPHQALVTCRLTHAGAQASFVLHGWRAFALHGLQNGDTTVELNLLGADGKPLRGPGATAARTITVNRDATRLPRAFRRKK